MTSPNASPTPSPTSSVGRDRATTPRTLKSGAQRDGPDRNAWSIAPPDHARLGRATAARVALRAAALAATEAAVRARSVAELLDDALAALSDATTFGVHDPGPAAARHPIDTLSPREREVLALVAEGCSNRAIAEILFVSPNTVKTHVAALLSKLHADSRIQLAAIAAFRFHESAAISTE